MARRFYVPQSFATPNLLLTGKEAHHLLHVLRLTSGEQAWIFDGAGAEALVRVGTVSRDSATLEILERRAATTETNVPLILGSAVPKGERFRWLVEKCTELGIHTLVPLQTARSIVDPREGKLERLRQTVVESSKQCRRSSLMQLGELTDWKTFIAREFPNHTIAVAHPAGESWTPSDWDVSRPIVLAVGPEGGFTEPEIELATAAGARLLSLGPRVLRIETAALALAALFASLTENGTQSLRP